MATIASQPLNARIDRWLFPREVKPVAQWKVGTEADVELTLITDDYQRLSCANDEVVAGAHCAFRADKRHWPRERGAPVDDNKADVIQPYRTADTNQLILVSGLWAQPEVAMRLHNEPPHHFPEKKQLRFVAYCKVRFVGEITADLRWQRGASWQEKQKGLVAQPLSCTLTPPES
jgi:hypothetical protein